MFLTPWSRASTWSAVWPSTARIPGAAPCLVLLPCSVCGLPLIPMADHRCVGGVALSIQWMWSSLDSHGGYIGDAPSMARLAAQLLTRVSTCVCGRGGRIRVREDEVGADRLSCIMRRMEGLRGTGSWNCIPIMGRKLGTAHGEVRKPGSRTWCWQTRARGAARSDQPSIDHIVLLSSMSYY
jgi:hypothetical protein